MRACAWGQINQYKSSYLRADGILNQALQHLQGAAQSLGSAKGLAGAQVSDAVGLGCRNNCACKLLVKHEMPKKACLHARPSRPRGTESKGAPFLEA